MATKTEKAAEDVINEVVQAVGDICDRIITLRVQGNTEGSGELAKEAETIISENLRGNRKGFAAARTTTREGVRRAMATEPAVSAEVEVIPARPDWLTALVAEGSKQVRVIAETNTRGNDSVAQIMLDIRRRTLDKDGLPDLKGSTHQVKTAAADVYADVLSDVEGDDLLTKAVESNKRAVRRMVVDMRVHYIRALDNVDNEDRALFAPIQLEEGQTLSEAVSKHYDIKLQTLAELEAERRANKALEAGAGGSDGEEVDGGTGDVGLVQDLSGFEMAIAGIKANVQALRKIQDASNLSEEESKQAGAALEALINELGVARESFA